MQRGITYAPHQSSTTAPVVPCAPMDSPFRGINRTLRPFPRVVEPTTVGSSQYTRSSWHAMNSITCKARQTLTTDAKDYSRFRQDILLCTPHSLNERLSYCQRAFHTNCVLIFAADVAQRITTPGSTASIIGKVWVSHHGEGRGEGAFEVTVFSSLS